MFHSEGAVNPGEPPTGPALWSESAGVSYEDLEAGTVGGSETREVVHEADSGYENSPSSTAGNSAFIFDHEYNADASRTSRFPVEGGASRDLVSQPSYTLIERRAPGTANLAGGDRAPACRLAASTPISIPSRLTVDNCVPDYYQQSRSNPLRASEGPNSFQMLVERSIYPLPLSWPTMTFWGLREGRREQRRPEGGDNRTGRRMPANRRLLIDSDASSVSSSESDGPEDVFDAEVDFVSSFSVTELDRPVIPSAPSSSEGPRGALPLQPHAARRNRSVSVNLPVDRTLAEAISDVGRSLRRLSDEFSRQRQVFCVGSRGVIARRCTIADFDCSTMRHFESDDSDDSIVDIVSDQQSRR